MMYFNETPPSYFDGNTSKVCECLTVPSSNSHHFFKSNQIHMEVCM